MSEMKHDGGPAFPPAYEPDPNDYTKAVYRGLTKRDWFAAQALAGMLAMPSDPDSGNFHNNCGEPFIGAARYAYRMADAMLAARAESLKVQGMAE